MTRGAVLLGVMLAVGATPGVARAAVSGGAGRMGASVVAVALVAVVAGVLRRRPWALGSAFFVGLFTLWISAALGLRHDLSAAGAALGI